MDSGVPSLYSSRNAETNVWISHKKHTVTICSHVILARKIKKLGVKVAFRNEFGGSLAATANIHSGQKFCSHLKFLNNLQQIHFHFLLLLRKREFHSTCQCYKVIKVWIVTINNKPQNRPDSNLVKCEVSCMA